MGCGASKDSHGAVITTTTPLKPPPHAGLPKQASAAPNSISAVVAAKNNNTATAKATADATPPTIQKSASIAPSETGTVQNQTRAPMVKDVKQVSAAGVVAVSSSFVEHHAAIPIVEGVAAVVEGSVAAAVADTVVEESQQKSEVVEPKNDENVVSIN
jgi:hypothetical protein